MCRLKHLRPGRGAAAVVEGMQVALFRTHDDRVYAVQQLDPYSGARVISRGIVGSLGDAPTVTSPMYRQVFDLQTGSCLEPVGMEQRSLATFEVEVVDGVVMVMWPSGDDGPVSDPQRGGTPSPP